MEIKNRFSGETIYETRLTDVRSAVREAIASGADLYGADLGGADLYGANLRAANLGGADLGGANLYGADLGRADLRWADLGGAHLGGADLRGANLGGADLRGANLYAADLRGAILRGAMLGGADLGGAILRGAQLAWQSHWLVGSVLFREAGKSVPRRKIAGLIAISIDWCWDKFMAIDDRERDWALDVLSQYIVDGDGSPRLLREWADARTKSANGSPPRAARSRRRGIAGHDYAQDVDVPEDEIGENSRGNCI